MKDSVKTENQDPQGAPPVSAEIMRAVEALIQDLSPLRRVTQYLAGELRTVFHGRGLEIKEIRDYVPGDEVRAIDWNVTARSGRPQVKTWHDERDFNVLLVLDRSGSMRFGSAERTKEEAAFEVATLLSLVALRGKASLGTLSFGDENELFFPPRRGEKRIMEALDVFARPRKGCAGRSLAAALHELGLRHVRRSILFVISDFLFPEVNNVALDRALGLLSSRHEIIAVRVYDPAERQLKGEGLTRVCDLETGETREIDLGDERVRESQRENMEKRDRELRRLITRRRGTLIEVSSEESVGVTLMRFFHQRRGSS